MRASIVAEKAGIPSVTFVVKDFVQLANHTARGEGMYDLRIAEYAGAIHTHSDADIDEAVEKTIISQVIEGLTKPIAERKEEEAEPDIREVTFRGTFEEVNGFCYRRGWTDGLPIIPPTIEKVEQFLRYTDRPADEEIAVFPLANLRATPWNIAVNGVMAGCRPEYMPILIAAAEAIGEPQYRLKDIGNTCGCRPFLLINGPITKQLDIHVGTGLISPGARKPGATTAVNPNSTIGRALHLIVMNIAGFKPGISEMSVFGHPQSFVIAEDEEGSPWEPYHVEQGFDRETSTVTAMAWMGMMGPESESKGDKANIHLKHIGSDLGHGMHPISYRFGPNLMVSVLMPPPIAQVVATGGYSKQGAVEQIFNNSRRTVRDINRRLIPEKYSVHHFAEVMQSIPKSLDVEPGKKIPAVVSPDLIHLVVCGSRERNRTLLLFSFYTNPVTKAIKLPTNWDKMLP